MRGPGGRYPGGATLVPGHPRHSGGSGGPRLGGRGAPVVVPGGPRVSGAPTARDGRTPGSRGWGTPSPRGQGTPGSRGWRTPPVPGSCRTPDPCRGTARFPHVRRGSPGAPASGRTSASGWTSAPRRTPASGRGPLVELIMLPVPSRGGAPARSPVDGMGVSRSHNAWRK